MLPRAIQRRAICLLLAGTTVLSIPVHECCLARQARAVVGMPTETPADRLAPTPTAAAPKCCSGCARREESSDRRNAEPVAAAVAVEKAATCCGDDWCCRQGCCKSRRPGHHRDGTVRIAALDDAGPVNGIVFVAGVTTSDDDGDVFDLRPAEAAPPGLSPLLLSSILRN